MLRLTAAQAERYHTENAVSHWRSSRHLGDEARTKRIYKELRGLLDDLAEELKSWRPDDWYENQRFWTDADAEDRDAVITEAQEEWLAEHTEGEEKDAVEQAEGAQEKIVTQAEVEEEEAAKQAEGEEEMAAE